MICLACTIDILVLCSLSTILAKGHIMTMLSEIKIDLFNIHNRKLQIHENLKDKCIELHSFKFQQPISQYQHHGRWKDIQLNTFLQSEWKTIKIKWWKKLSEWGLQLKQQRLSPNDLPCLKQHWPYYTLWHTSYQRRKRPNHLKDYNRNVSTPENSASIITIHIIDTDRRITHESYQVLCKILII